MDEATCQACAGCAPDEEMVPRAVLMRLLDGMDAILYVTDPETDTLLLISEGARARFGLRGGAVGGVCWHAFSPQPSRRCDFCPIGRLRESPGQAVSWEEHDDEGDRYYSNTAKLIEWIDGRMVLLRYCSDMTEHKQAESALKHALSEQAVIEELLIEANAFVERIGAVKREYLSRINHEMRTPMNAIIGMASIARNTSDPQKRDYCLEKIYDASRQLLFIVNNVPQMSPFDGGSLELPHFPSHGAGRREETAVPARRPDINPKLESLLPVLNVRAGMAQLMNNEKLYSTLLKNFSGRQTADDLIGHVTRRDFSAAARAARTLKETALKLGLAELAEIASEIEKQANLKLESDSLVERLNYSVDAAVGAIRLFLELEEAL